MGSPEHASAEAVTRALALISESASQEGAEAAEICHGLATILDRMGALSVAEALHHRAGVLLAGVPVGRQFDRQRVQWARCLADNLTAQQRPAEAAAVLQAARALAEGLLGPDDPETASVRSRLHASLGGDARP
jgi:hypothetical protein